MSTLADQNSPEAIADTRAEEIPPLENGDHLTADEFRRRYEAMPYLKKAELIRGVVYLGAAEIIDGGMRVSSPVRAFRHANPHAMIVGWLTHYQASAPAAKVFDNPTVRLAADSTLQPDAVMFIAGRPGSDASITPDDYIEGPPQLVVEVAGASFSVDMHIKLDAYRSAGVSEYIVWRVTEREIDWFVRLEDRFQKQSAGPDGFLKSKAFPGLWLEASALIASDLKRVFEVLEQGLRSPEHAAFRGS